MRIVVSGTHASGKSTLISDFALARRGFTRFDDPYELIEDPDATGPGSFVSQLRFASERLQGLEPDASVIAERGPLDFLAYLLALHDLGRADTVETVRMLTPLAARAMRFVDLMVVLPPETSITDDEDPAMRTAMASALLDLADDPDLIGPERVLELSGSPAERLMLLCEQYDASSP